MKLIPTCVFMALMFALSACTNDPYDTGDGSLSDMRADFVEAVTDADAYFVGIETDDGELLPLTGAASVSWMERPDTIYRALLYYNKVMGDGGTYLAQPLSVSQVFTPPIVAASDMEGEVKTDPVVFESAWTSRNGKYLNLGVKVKTGAVDGEYGTQTIGLVCDDVATNDDGSRTVFLRLCHDQNGVPEYHSVSAYISIAVSRLPIEPADGDKVQVEINTYGGTLTKTFPF